MERASAFGFEAMNPGTLYRTLRQMEKEGIVESTWETSRGGPARRMYSITDAGRAYLDFWAKSLEQYQQDRKSTRLNSSHANISYAVFCLKKKKNNKLNPS